ncbi:MAG TPA: hypothetical protein VEW47_00680 [Candidatus Dormibacteraeota bacterium]|nr:hypothetical protein [Candidatus Dormibacteraeota bacterium]
MRQGFKVAAGTAAILIVLSVVPIVTSTLQKGRSPYLSALSDLAAGSALATPTCNDKTCAKEPGRGPACVKAGPGVTCLVKSGCFSSTC